MAREMKDSGVEWIGQIPKEWSLRRLQFILKERNEKNTDYKTNNILSLTASKGVIPYSERESGGNKHKDDITSYKIIRPNDIVINSMNVLAGSVGLSKYFGCSSPVYYMLYSENEFNDIRYYNYIFQSTAFQKSLRGLGNGIMIHESENGKLNTIRMRIPMEKLNKLLMPLPPLSEQQKIADFLDEKVKEIDNAIEKTKETIELYKKYKQAVITEAVTKGLDPNVEMKNTYAGICPIKWNFKKIKYSCEMQAGDNITSKEVDIIGSYPVYGGNGIRGYYNKSNCDGEHILIGRQGALAGNVHYVDEKIWATDHAVIVSDFRDDVKFMFYMFIAMDLNQYAYDTAAQPGISVAKIKNLEMAFPSVEEEKEIACFLDDITRKIDNIILNKVALTKRLENYKKSLIYEYVTGKRSS